MSYLCYLCFRVSLDCSFLIAPRFSITVIYAYFGFPAVCTTTNKCGRFVSFSNLDICRSSNQVYALSSTYKYVQTSVSEYSD